MTYTEPTIAIEGISEPAIANYFATINREEFTETASLFAEDGAMLAPFEKPIVGRENITAYLAKEATGNEVVTDAWAFTRLKTTRNSLKYWEKLGLLCLALM